ncbi:MAG TPA: homoserine dehydrogenase [Pyrinomonadaceae bacterium]|nr:homoserine dehydrogenase [Pyrinomonadaceae bacterium]
MTNNTNIVVLKFGSSVLRSEDDLPTAVHEIYRYWREGAQVIVVASAFGNTTDELIRRAERVCERPHQSVLPNLLATGEATSSALLTLALNRAGLAAKLLDEVQIGLRTVGGGTDAVPVAVNKTRLLNELRHAIVVLPGFVGRDDRGDKTVMGRGGSDLTALFLAHQLTARCILIKDVDGLYTNDPAGLAPQSLRFAQVSYDTAIRRGGRLVQTKALRFAAANRLQFSIGSIGAPQATEIGPLADRLDVSNLTPQPTRVTLLGCGTVGGGIYQRLAALPQHFELVGVGALTLNHTRELGVPEHLASTDIAELLRRECDVVVELTGATEYASAMVELALKGGRHVVTANKAMIAGSGDRLLNLASVCGVTIRYSAAVGGVLPALETIRRAQTIGPVKSFAGIVNATANYILDRLEAGGDLAQAIKAAQEAGYAEADPRLDLNGTDAAQKLTLLAREAFGVSLPLDQIHRVGIENIEGQLRKARAGGNVVRLVAECTRTEKGIRARVEPVELRPDHPLAQVAGAGNRLIVELEHGEQLVVSGTGAGRWPTTESVMADLFELKRQQLTNRSEKLEALEVCA